MDNGDMFKRYGPMAYMDGELSDADRAELGQSLTPEQRRMIALDQAIQDRVVDRLRETDRCPDALWQKVCSQIDDAGARSKPWRLWAGLAAAACVTIALGLMFSGLLRSEPLEVQVSFPQQIKAFAENAAIQGDQQHLEMVLRENDLPVSIGDITACNEKHRHHVQLLGMNVIESDKSKVRYAELRFSCCRRPVSTFVVKASAQVKPESFKAASSTPTCNQSVHHADGCMVVTMSHHPTTAVASLFDPMD